MVPLTTDELPCMELVDVFKETDGMYNFMEQVRRTAACCVYYQFLSATCCLLLVVYLLCLHQYSGEFKIFDLLVISTEAKPSLMCFFVSPFPKEI